MSRSVRTDITLDCSPPLSCLLPVRFTSYWPGRARACFEKGAIFDQGIRTGLSDQGYSALSWVLECISSAVTINSSTLSQRCNSESVRRVYYDWIENAFFALTVKYLV